MLDKLYSPDYQHPDTGVPICFVWDMASELLWLEPCETACDQWDVPESEYQETETLCKLWGEHVCGSAAEANRLIHFQFPDAFEEGICFLED